MNKVKEEGIYNLESIERNEDDTLIISNKDDAYDKNDELDEKKRNGDIIY